MRKVFWMGAAGLVASASLIYLAADFACRHPESWLSRCVTMSMARPITPESKNSATTHADAGSAVGQAVCGMTPVCPKQQPKLMLEPVAEECPEAPSLTPPAEDCEPIQVPTPGQTTLAVQDPGSAVDGITSSGTEPYRKAPSKKEAGAIPEECEVVPPSMPEPQVCGQDDFSYMPPYPEGEKPEVTPVNVPYVEEDAEAAEEPDCPLSVWFLWLKEMVGKQKSGKKCHMPKKSDLVPDASANEASAPSGIQTLDPSGPPSCQEDPYHDHQFPGCPHMGGCQRGGQCCPPPVTPKVKHHKKKKIQAHPVSISRARKKQSGKDPETSGVNGVDTMECRPSDVKLDEMDTSKPD